MTEGYQDREDPGLTVRFPLVDRPGESLLVWTTTPWTLTSNVAAAVGPDLRYVQVRQGDARLLARPGHPQGRRSAGPFEVLEERPGARPRRLALRGPVRRPAGRPGGLRDGAGDAPGGRTSTASSPGTRSARRRGPGIVHIAPGCGAEDFAARQGARPAGHRARSTRSGIFIDGFGSLSRPRRPRRRRADRRATSGTTAGSTASSRSPTATRTAGAAARRSSSASSTSGSSAWARSTTSRARS